jgi:hypothetical protein
MSCWHATSRRHLADPARDRIAASTLVLEFLMLGPTNPRRLDEPIAVSLEGLVPANHFYRHLEAKLDLSFV